MQRYYWLLAFLFSTLLIGNSLGQTEGKKKFIKGLELGVDIGFGDSEFGGNFGGSAKLAFRISDYLVFGPSIRYDRLSFKNTSQYPVSYLASDRVDVFGGGIFAHLRFVKYLFAAIEIDALKSPYYKKGDGNISLEESWAMTAFAGLGFSINIKDKVRIQGAVMYDVLNLDHSPYARSYPVYEAGDQNVRLDLQYRFGVFIPLNKKAAQPE